MTIVSTTEGTTGAQRAAAHISVVIPCLNEAENIEECVNRALGACSTRTDFAGEVIVVDNGSEDGSAELARNGRRDGRSTSRVAATGRPTSPASQPRAATTS